MAAIGLQSQFRRSPPYASLYRPLPDCVHHDAFTTPNSHRGARRACRAAAGRRRGGAGAAFLARLPRQSVQPRRAAGAAAPERAAAGGRSRAGGAGRHRRRQRRASTASKVRCASSPARSSNCSTATSSSRCSSSACRTTPSIASSSSAPRADCPPAAQPRAMSPPAPVNAPPAAAPGRRSDVFDPAQHPNAPGAPRVLGNEAAAAADPDCGQRAAGRRARRPRAGRSARSLDARRQSAGAAAAPMANAAPMPPSQLPPPPARNPSATGAQLATLPPSATPKDEYDMAYGYVLHKDYALAEQAFRDFLRKYPDEKLVPDAQYWLGESLFQRQRYRDAAESFLAVSTKYRALRQGAGRAAAARPVARRAAIRRKRPAPRWPKSGANIPRASASVKRGVDAGTKACALLRRAPVSAAGSQIAFLRSRIICRRWCWRFPAGRIRPR